MAIKNKPSNLTIVLFGISKHIPIAMQMIGALFGLKHIAFTKFPSGLISSVFFNSNVSFSTL